MKKNILCAVLLAITVTSFSQQTNPSKPVTRADYLKKSKNQKTIGWILLGGGAALSISGVIIIASKASTLDLESDGFAVGEVMNYTGLAAMVGSIPLFIASGKNKRKGVSLSFKNEKAQQIQKSSFVYRPVPSVTLKIRL
jgi:hypothetical protein